MKLILDILDGVVIRVQRLDDSVIDNVTSTPPYCKSDDLGNGYAVSLRKKDMRLAEGKNFEVRVIADGEPLNYLGKKASAKQNRFVNVEGDDSVRMQTVLMKRVGYRIDSEGKNLYPTPEQEAECIKVFGKDFYTTGVAKIMNYGTLDPNEQQYVSDKLSQLTEDTRLMVINQVANSFSGSDVKQHIESAKAWWNRFLGTKYEKKGLSAIAGILAIELKFGEAVRLYEAMLERKNLTAEQRIEIEEKIYFIGKGDELTGLAKDAHAKAQSKVDTIITLLRGKVADLRKLKKTDGDEVRIAINKKYDDQINPLIAECLGLCETALGFIEEFEQVATGRAAFHLGAEMETLEAKVLSIKAKFSAEKNSIEKAVQLLTNPRRINETV